MLELWEEGAHSSEVLESSKATGSGKLQTLGGMGPPRGGGYVKAQELQEVTVTVPTLSVSSVASFSVHGMIGSIPLELLVDTGAVVSLLNASVWKGINNTETHTVLQQWSGKKLVGINGTPLSVKWCELVCLLGVLSLKGVLWCRMVLWLMLLWGWTSFKSITVSLIQEKKLLRFSAVNLSVGLHGVHAAADKNTTKNMESVGLVTMEKILVPSESEMELIVKAAGSVTEGVWMVENNSASFHGVIVARAVACPKDGLIPICVINSRHCSLPLKKGVELAKMEIIEQGCIWTVQLQGNEKLREFHQLTRKPCGHLCLKQEST